MKTDCVLTMDEYFNEICAVPKYVSRPASDARHIPITAECSPDLGTGEQLGHACRSDRWGHPCPGSVKSRHETEQTLAVSMEWQIRR
jgi:hypothetical protein